MPTNNASRYAGVSLLFISVTFNCPETEAEPRYSLLAAYPWEREFDSAKLPELRFLGLGISPELLRVSSRRRSFALSTLSPGASSRRPVYAGIRVRYTFPR